MSRRPLTASAADQALFVDRTAEVARITKAVDLGLNTFVTGPAGSGKTSLLRHLQRRLEEAGEPVVYVRVEAAESINDALLAIARAIDPERRGGSPQSTVAEDETDLVIVEDAAAHRFGEARPVVVLVDGPSETITSVLFGRYRDRLWETPQLRWVAATRHAAPSAPADAFFDRVIELGPLSQEAGAKLLELRAPDLSAATRRDLAMALGRALPLYWVLAAQSLALAAGEPSDVIATLEAERAATEELPQRLRRLYEAVNELGPVHAGDAQLLARVDASRPWVVSGLKDLEGSGLVRSAREGRRVVYDALRNWLVRGVADFGSDFVIDSPDSSERTYVEVKGTAKR